MLGIVLAAALWWAYFDLSMLTAERRLSEARGEERARLARDSYSYLHLSMVGGIVFAALGIKQTLAHVGDPLDTIPAVALCGGVALYLLGHNAFRLRAHLRGGIGPLPHHPRRPHSAALRAGRLRDGDLTRVSARAPCAIEDAEHGLFTQVPRRTISRTSP